MFFSFSVLGICIFAQFNILFILLFCIVFSFENMDEWKGRGLTRVSLCIWYFYRTQKYSNGVKGVEIEQVHYFPSFVTSKIIVVIYEILLRSSHQKWSFSSWLYSPATLSIDSERPNKDPSSDSFEGYIKFA